MTDLPGRDALRDHLHQIDLRLGKLEATVATRLEVKETIAPLQASVSQLTEDARELFEAHKVILQEKGARERREWEDKTVSGITRRYAPVVALIVSLFTLFRILGTFVELWLQHKIQ